MKQVAFNVVLLVIFKSHFVPFECNLFMHGGDMRSFVGWMHMWKSLKFIYAGFQLFKD
jgi:hypothetical protein